jgi:hypothetical protein
MIDHAYCSVNAILQSVTSSYFIPCTSSIVVGMRMRTINRSYTLEQVVMTTAHKRDSRSSVCKIYPDTAISTKYQTPLRINLTP